MNFWFGFLLNKSLPKYVFIFISPIVIGRYIEDKARDASGGAGRLWLRVCNNTWGFYCCSCFVVFFFPYLSAAWPQVGCWIIFLIFGCIKFGDEFFFFLTNSNPTGGVMKRERTHSPFFKVSYPMTRNSICFTTLLNVKLFFLKAMSQASP